MNEFDRFVSHELKPLGYVRYGDDFILWARGRNEASVFQKHGKIFLQDKLGLNLHTTNHALQPTWMQLHFLGIEFWPDGHRLDKRMRERIKQRVTPGNVASYQALLEHHGNKNAQKNFIWEQVLSDNLI